jgi:hypothetical protein
MTHISAPLTTIGYKVATLDDIRGCAPATFSDHESPKLSDRYSFVPTLELLKTFELLNWLPTYAKQNGSSPYARHMIRLTNPDLGFMDLKSDKVKPQVILDNSHNGGSPAMAHMGLFRLVCTNGLIVAMPGMFTSVKLRHVSIDINELKQLMSIVAEQYTTIGLHIDEMQQHTLNQDQKEEFVIKAIAHREPHVFIQEDGTIDVKKVTALINPKQIVEPLRSEDAKEDLWSIFNIVQERLVKGEFEKHSASGRRSRPRGITNATRNIDFNKVLWTLAEEYMVNA